MTAFNDILSKQEARIRDLEARFNVMDRRVNAPTSADSEKGKGRRVNFCGETYYIDEQGNAYLKTLTLTGGTIVVAAHWQFREDGAELVLEYSSTGAAPWTEKGRWF
jgi:hypothetical protein